MHVVKATQAITIIFFLLFLSQKAPPPPTPSPKKTPKLPSMHIDLTLSQ